MFFELAEYAPIGFISCDTDGTINYVNRKLLELMDSPDSAATKQVNLFELPALLQSGFSDKLRECMSADKLITYEMRYTSIWGKSNWLRVHFSPNKENGVVIGAHIVTDDITEKKRQETELLERVQSDPLTQAYNRNVLETVLLKRLDESEIKGLSGCFAILDVDDFKQINDSHGHKAGDSILRLLAVRIKKELREYDLLIRTGGDEFLIYLHNISNKENAGRTIDRIMRKSSGSYQLQDILDNEAVCITVSYSIGISMLPEDGTAVDVLMAKADKALYAVKKGGKAGYGFFS
jgi:diguanylate cyclase (GGDEF)-like protein/PAS domain S-box-containing protein